MTGQGLVARLWALLKRSVREPAASPATDAGAPGSTLATPVTLVAGASRLGDRDRQITLAALQRAAGTSGERRALRACLDLHARGQAPSELLYLAAKLFAERGESAVALGLLEELKELRAWLFCAELLEKAGEHLRAKALWEQALAEDIDASQALERISRGATGAGVSASAGRDQVTLLEHEVSNHTLRIVGEAGRGGAATVYQAVDGGLGRTVALKVYHESERFRAHLLHEARTAVALAGPGVVRVFDADPKKGWVAMEWAAGGSLRQHLQMPTGHVTLETLVWLYELVATLATIHRSGFVHADLKPANILFRHDNSVILSDFGLAVRAGERHRGQSAGYISPKRARGALARPEDDVYALGCVLVQVAECPASEGSCRVEAQALADSLLASDRPKDAGEVLVALSPPGKFH